MGPTQPVFDSTTATGYYNWPGNTLQSADNPLQVLNLAKSQGTTYRSVGNVQADYTLPFLAGLKATVNLGYDVAKITQQVFNPSALHGEIKSGQEGYGYRTDPTQLNTVLDAYLNYAAPLNAVPGNIDVTAGYSYAQSHTEFPSLTVTGLSTDILGINGFPTAQNTSPGSPNIQESKLISFFGRLNYNLNDRYLAGVNVRHDGSSRFGPGHAWGTFPAVSFGWRISEEPFMQGFKPVSDLKLRASWGKTGNQSFANYIQYVAYLYCNQQAQVQFGNQFVSTIRPGGVDRDIAWEQTSSYDVGLDYGLVGQRFSGSIDWYNKKTTGLIFVVLEPGQPVNSFFVCQQQYQNGKPVEGKYVSLADTIASSCDAASLRAYHDPAPKWILGHSSYLSYRNFDLSFTLRAWLGNYVHHKDRKSVV